MPGSHAGRRLLAMLLCLISLAWLAVTVVIVAASRCAADGEQASAALVSDDASDDAERFAAGSPRPHCEACRHSSSANLRAIGWHGRTRTARAAARVCHRAAPACRRARRIA
jgi:hypothetical protein